MPALGHRVGGHLHHVSHLSKGKRHNKSDSRQLSYRRSMLKFHERDKASREQKLQVMHLSRTGTLPKNSSFSATLFLYLPASYRPKGPMCVWHVREKCLVPVSAPPDLQAFASACTWATSLCLESSDSWQTIRMKLRVCHNIDVRREMLPFHHVPHFSFFSTLSS